MKNEITFTFTFTFTFTLHIIIQITMDTTTPIKCKARTKTGNPCKRQAVPGLSYCWQHNKNQIQQPTSKRKVCSVSAIKNTEVGIWIIKRSKPCEYQGRLILDLDGTLIHNKMRRSVELYRQDPVVIAPHIIKVLKKYRDSGYYLGIYTNQSKMLKNAEWAQAILEKVEKVVVLLANAGILVDAYIAGGKNSYRKPMTDMVTEIIMPKCSINSRQPSIYCGDMAGRAQDPGFTDYYLVHNLNLLAPKSWIFATPEQIFTDNKNAVKYQIVKHPYRDNPNLDLRMYLPRYNVKDMFQENPKDLNLFIMIGPAACGKTTLAEYLVKRYQALRLSTDDIGSLTTLKKRFLEAVNQKVPAIVIDNTNPTNAIRDWYVDNAPDYHVTYVWFDFPIEFAYHMNHYRVQQTHSHMKKIPLVAYRTYYKRLEPPKDSYDILHLTTLPDIPGVELDNYYWYWYETK